MLRTTHTCMDDPWQYQSQSRPTSSRLLNYYRQYGYLKVSFTSQHMIIMIRLLPKLAYFTLCTRLLLRLLWTSPKGITNLCLQCGLRIATKADGDHGHSYCWEGCESVAKTSFWVVISNKDCFLNGEHDIWVKSGAWGSRVCCDYQF